MSCIECVLFFSVVSCALVTAEYDSCPTSNSEAPVVKLRDSLICAYDSLVGPVTYEEAVNVTFSFILKYFTYDPLTSILSFDAWVAIAWTDKHLKWNPTDHNNIKNIHLHTSAIWTPDISLYNSANQGDDPLAVSYTKCVVSYNGRVMCVPPVHYDALCTPNIVRYPFDTHNCSMRFGSWIHKGEEINISLSKDVLVTKDMTSNGEWKLDSYKVLRHPGKFKCCPDETYPSVEINFMISRLAVAHAASIVIPTLVAMMLTLISIVVSPVDPERMTICYVNLVVHLLQIQYTSFNLPLKGEGVPLIILFGRDSMMMAIFALICSIYFKHIMTKKTTPPSWISSLIGTLSCCKLGYSDISIKGVAFNKENDDQETIVDSGTNLTKTDDWALFGIFLNRLLLIGYILGYLIMLFAFLP